MTDADATVVHAIRRHAGDTPGRVAVRLVSYAGRDPAVEELTFAALDLRARRLAAWLQARSRPGDRVLLVHPDDIEQVVAYIGCLYAGVVPLNPARPARGQAHQIERTRKILADAQVSLVLTGSAQHDLTTELLSAAGGGTLQCVTTDQHARADADAWRPPAVGAGSLAFLQYTSGSTGDPKGVMISHGALVHNARAIIELTGGRAGDTACGWLPLHHDMGLVGQFLTPLYGGGTTVMMAPADFVRRPLRWLQLIERYRASYTAAPNFALDLCGKRVTAEQAAGLDLSSLRVILNGAEPIDGATVARFLDRFAVAGLDPRAVKPGYGMAEATLMVTATPRERGLRTVAVDAADLQRGHVRPVTAPAGRPTMTLVGCGRSEHLRVRVVDPDSGAVLPDGRVGEVWVGGGSLASGYWRRPELTEVTFNARTADGDGPFLRTGDLGALWQGELYITGRLKEVIIVRGRNIYPHDAERVMGGAHAAFAGATGCVFSLPGPGEEAVAVQELRPAAVNGAELPELARAIRESLSESLGVAVANVVLVPPSTVRRTTSGKIERLTMRELFLTGNLRAVYQDLTPTARARCRRPADAIGGPA